MKDIRTLLLFLVLGLLCAILILILINAIRRTCFTHTTNGRYRDLNAREKYVDLYATSLNALPKKEQVLPGMTALIDLGATNLETGIYMLQDDWIKISLPDVGDCYHILRGESAGKQHTIKPSFLHEIHIPSETQVFTNENLYQELQEQTAIVFIRSDIHMACHMTIVQENAKFSNALVAGRSLQIINTSQKFTFTFQINKNHQIAVAPQSIRHVNLLINITNPLEPYQLGAIC